MRTKGGLVLPSAVARGLQSEAAREQRQLIEEFYDVSGKLEYYNRELQRLDGYLRIVLAKPHTTVEGLRPGYYHLVRMRPGHPAYIKPVEGPNGEWRDLDSSVFDLAAADDLWNDRTQRERRARARKAEEARQRQRDRDALDRAHEFDTRLKSATNVSIAVPWSVS